MLDLEHFLPYRLSVLSNQVSAGIARTYAERFGLSVTEWRVIAILGRFPGISATEVTERSAMDKVAVSRAVRRLIDQGRIRRQANAEDRRAKHLFLSDQGQSVFDAIAPAALAYEEELLGVLSASERRQLDALLDRLLEASRA
ncbi:MarR family winged helix-turn-helix transcriptional regulator [Wenzhouxiangella marina]|uniref:MarR family transcriptional regulator n=1 Tax=Wenzhouxiangella marina TaxID=1579979 RepID=A0A0K0XYH7_9GAMM|nr:MarR family transcriptional regulator [Wenzhouxiangella marina]AKS42692.1 MarR family transcriptional regulator [Wenzhouxiangella marina]MBB6088619.1 DNA-binding MarR family transcriptional regulator [Wenzhouxiangella marina]